MAPKVKFSREQIIDAAFEIAQTEGIDAITMRKIAKKINSSVAPIYVNFKDVNELNEAVMERIISISLQLIKEEDSVNPLIRMGKACLRFAMEYSVIFRDLVAKNGKYMQGYDIKMMPALMEEIQKDAELRGLPVDELKKILLKIIIFQLGLSIMAANSLLPEELSKQDMMDILSSATDDVIMSAKLKRGFRNDKRS
ncbi:MAG TPA: TetR/AcrR family transcriptional regulator [Bacillota bacterium]|nr:TetR/AcrR family transcriptional regulator [Bacillota bacterium]HOY88277.1 TetR/AcrR family transcriptional regulator [Bacillota bacterium]HPM64286.1 TetR/AcrR family transcriptional regulator [Bacillota bacterium]HQJ24580.1 TetR/AcrR family transcriptional regulator [Bacillota bacterium]